jgi:hypothetical protein
MSSYYRGKREAGVYQADEAAAEKAGQKFDKKWNAQMEQAQAEAEEAQESEEK